MKTKLSAETLRSCVSVINRGLTGVSFELGDEFRKYVLDEFNIKIQKTSTGHICYYAHKVGEGQAALSDGEAFCLFLRHQGCTLSPDDVTGSMEVFCRRKFV